MLDIKSKSSREERIKGKIVCLLFLLITAIGVVLFFPMIEKHARIKEEDMNGYKNEFFERILKSNYAIYQNTISDKEKFQARVELYLQRNDKIDKEEFRTVINEFNNWIEEQYHYFFTSIVEDYELEYYIIKENKKTPSFYNNAKLSSILEEYPFYIVFQYNSDGMLEIPYYLGIDKKSKNQLVNLSKYILKDFFEKTFNTYESQSELYEDEDYMKELEDQLKISGITFIYASENDIPYIDMEKMYWINLYHFLSNGFIQISIVAIFIVILGAFLLPLNKKWSLENKLINRISFEVVFTGGLFLFFNLEIMGKIAYQTVKGNLWNNSFLYGVTKNIISYGINLLMWIVFLGVWFCLALSIRQIFTLGLRRYLKEKVFIISICVKIKKRISRFFHSFLEVDLTNTSDQLLVRLVSINFVILCILCSFWFFGIFVLIMYSFILFSILHKRIKKIKTEYQILLQATNKMAMGNLEIFIEEDLGLFEPLKAELTKIQEGFKKAVEEEVKSQRMKTELVTNVSHDLKTPLTAIITYVNLLKEENTSEEDRKSYIEILDKKSQRLKRLIEDLFEISKATTNNMQLNFMEVDLVALIKEVEIELEEKIKDSTIDFRSYFAKEKIVLRLDSEKTYRIFENLIVNITKYAMPHSRAYINVEILENRVIVTLKNMSEAELELNPEELTERFIRGDRARNTEGTGLGLAIVKSFVELQQGTFKIVVDGDLFKAIIEWEKVDLMKT